MNEIVFKTKRGKVISAFFAGDGDYPKANLSYSLEDIAGEAFLDETGKSSSLEVKIPCEVIENANSFGLSPKSFSVIEEHWQLNFNLYELDAKLNSWRITWPEQTGNKEYRISLVDANDVNTGTEPEDPNEIKDPGPDDIRDNDHDSDDDIVNRDPEEISPPPTPPSPYTYYIAVGAVASCIVAALLWLNYDRLSSKSLVCSSAEQLIRAIENEDAKTSFQNECRQELLSLSESKFDILINKALVSSPSFAIEVGDFFNPNIDDSFLQKFRTSVDPDIGLAVEYYYKADKLGITTASNKMELLCRQDKTPIDELFTKEYCR